MDSILYNDEKIENLLPLVQQIDAFLTAKGCTLKEAGKTTGANNIVVNRTEYKRGDENVFITVNKPKQVHHLETAGAFRGRMVPITK
jgi:hypothetical protein